MTAHGNTVLVTGGASGIGLAIAQAFSERGSRVLISGRNPEKLAQAKRANPEFHVYQCDITRQDQVKMMFQEIADEHADLNVLVNNAGVAFLSDFLFDDELMAKAQQEVETNVLGTLRVTKAALPLLLSKGEAAIITISSAVALVPLPTTANYSATKAALHSLSVSLRYQLRGTHVRVFEIMPPTVDTEMGRNIGGRRLSPRDVARAVIAGFERDTYEIRMGPAKALYAAYRVSPRLAEYILRRATSDLKGTNPSTTTRLGGG
jgi:uncharacterized oxidoreductase